MTELSTVPLPLGNDMFLESLDDAIPGFGVVFDPAFIQDGIDRVVPDPAEVHWVARRGPTSPMHGDRVIEDAFAAIIWIELATGVRIAAFPVSEWEDRETAVEESLKAMVSQREAHEAIGDLT